MKSRSLRALMRGANRALHRWFSASHRATARSRRSGAKALQRFAKALTREPAPGIGASNTARATAAAHARGEIAGSYRNAFGTRRYKLYVPGGYRGQPLPLVVMLHGCKQDPDDFAAGTRMNHLAEEHGCLVLYPAQARSANAFHCWNWFDHTHQQRDSGEPSLIAGIVRKVMRTHAVAPGRVYACGMSAGGAMAVVLAAAYPELFTAIGVHSGLPYGCARDANSAYAAMKRGATNAAGGGARRNVPVIVFHGEDDDVVHPVNGARIVEQFVPSRGQRAASVQERVALVNGRTCRVRVYRAPSGQPLAEHWRVEGAGHAWCGGSPLGRYTETLGPDASREMLRFFAGQRAARGASLNGSTLGSTFGHQHTP